MHRVRIFLILGVYSCILRIYLTPVSELGPFLTNELISFSII